MRILDTDVCVEILRHNTRVITRRRNTLDRVATMRKAGTAHPTFRGKGIIGQPI